MYCFVYVWIGVALIRTGTPTVSRAFVATHARCEVAHAFIPRSVIGSHPPSGVDDFGGRLMMSSKNAFGSVNVGLNYGRCPLLVFQR